MSRVMQCPKCRSTEFQLSETFEEVETREVRDGVASSDSSHWAGSLLGTSCECNKCGHQWVPRRATLEGLGRDHV